MIEAVGEKNLNKYFKTIKNNLNQMELELSKLLLLKMNFLIDTKKIRILYKNIFFQEVFYLFTINKRLYKENWTNFERI